MFSLFKKPAVDIDPMYQMIMDQARQPKLYQDFGVPDKPIGRFQMIALHTAPVMIAYARQGATRDSQALFDRIFKDIEYSFREIGVGDLSVPKKMKAYMQDFNGIVQAHAAEDANHIAITARNVFGEDGDISQEFGTYIDNLFEQDRTS